MITLTTSNGLSVLIDVQDLDLGLSHTWYAHRDGRTYYAWRRIREKGKVRFFMMHREILGLKCGDGMIVDHINGNGLDNQRTNLRIVDPGQNMYNRRARLNGSSIYKGVAAKRNKWQAFIQHDRTSAYLGIFATEELAARAYDRSAKKIFGEFARLNFPEKP